MESIKTRMYVFTLLGLMTVTLFAIVGAVLQEQFIQDQQKIHEISDVTSDQAILVQRIAFLSERLARAAPGEEFEDVRQRYIDAVLSLETSFDELETWIKLNDDKTNSVQKIYAKSGIREELRKYVVSAKERLDNDSSWQSLRANASYLARQGRAELSDLTESIRMQVLRTKQHKLLEVKWVGLSVLGIVMFGVIVVWLCIFRPMMKTIFGQQADLQRERKELQDKNRVLRESQTALEEAKIAAEAASRAKTEFLTNISHEIRTPMTAILGYADIYLSEGQTMEERQGTVRIIRKNAEDLMGLIDDILDVSKIEARELKIEKTSVALQKILSEVHSLMKVKSRHKGIDLQLEFNGLLPENIHTDPVRLRQILFNIIGNAIKFTKSGKVRVVTQCQRNSEGRRVIQFAVHDTGFGIPEEQQRRIFRPFVQLDASATRQYGGAGLGLALSKNLAVLLGGDLVLESSSPGQGSTFLITIDPGPEGDSELVTYKLCESFDEVEDSKVGHSDLLQGYCILVVDDSPDIRALLKVYLHAAGATVITASDGQEAIERIEVEKFDLVLCDLQMPRKDGYQTVVELRAKNMSLPILALTAHAMQEERIRCLSIGFNDHLVKPIAARKLVKTLVHFLKPQSVQTVSGPSPLVLDPVSTQPTSAEIS